MFLSSTVFNMEVSIRMQITEKKKRSSRQRRKGKIYPSECRVPKNSKAIKKAFLSDPCKEIEENNRKGKTRDMQMTPSLWQKTKRN